MHEIIHLQVGNCGNQIGTRFWENVIGEHGLDSDGLYRGTISQQLERINVYFNEASNNRYTPRAVLVDSKPSTADAVRAGVLGQLFRPDNYVVDPSGFGAAKCWPRGYYGMEAGFLDQVVDAVRREAEGCDCLQGFQMAHSLGGGTGSGLGTLLLSKLRDEFPDRTMATFSVLPSASVSESLVEPYNAVLSISELIEHADATICIDNEALYNIGQRTSKLQPSTYDDFTYLASAIMSGVTTPFRFPGQLHSDLRKLTANMVPSPRLHFLVAGSRPLLNPDGHPTNTIFVPEHIKGLFDPANIAIASDVRNGRYLACSAIFRAEAVMREVQDQLDILSRPINSMNWIPSNVRATWCSVPPCGMRASSTLVGNSTGVRGVFSRFDEQFTSLFRRKAYIWGYNSHLMDEIELVEAQSNMVDLMEEYQQCEDATSCDDDECTAAEPVHGVP
ncbi:Beta-1 and beta-2 tubulin [Apiospora arundinis]